MAGVVAGLEVVRLFAEKEIETLHPIEIVSFLAEEPSPFGISTVGSRGMAGMLSKDLLESLNDSKRMTLSAAIKEMGGDPLKITEAKRASRDVLAYLELHIEQGPSLFSQDIHIGVVTGIVGIYRGIINVVGKSNHAGTTQMETRKDALTAASEIVLALERICRDLDGVVGTIGKIEVFPNSSNVVPGNANMEMELRSLNASRAADALSLLKTALENIQKQRGIIINFKEWIGSDPVIFKEKIVKFICTACDQLEIPYLKMPSGAGHDANHMAKLAPTGMIFIPSRDGMSHCPEEWSEFEHICMGAELLARAITLLDREEDI
jgi:N-carbamoyl-L-amino-acid hydrolase